MISSLRYIVQWSYENVNASYYTFFTLYPGDNNTDLYLSCNALTLLSPSEAIDERLLQWFYAPTCDGAPVETDLLSPFVQGQVPPAAQGTAQECAAWGDVIPVAIRGAGWITGYFPNLFSTAVYLDASTFTLVRARGH
jgi:hypothetical protein